MDRREQGSIACRAGRRASAAGCLARVRGGVVLLVVGHGAWALPERPVCGNNSVVECDLAKVEVAGSNPVSRSNLRSHVRRRVGCPHVPPSQHNRQPGFLTAPSPSGKAEVCKTSIPGSNPGGAAKICPKKISTLTVWITEP